MYRPRVIPCLLLKNLGLIKTKRFKNPVYIGDPINAVKIFNDLEADELIFLDIEASKENRICSEQLIKDIGDEAFMPFAVGGGIRNLEQIKKIINCGAEKVVINSASISNPKLITEGANVFGSQSIVISIDVKNNFFGKQQIVFNNAKKKSKIKLLDYIKEIEDRGAGEIIINSVDHDGIMEGYNLDLIKQVADCASVPVVALGGAGKLDDFKTAIDYGASAVSAGSMFVFHSNSKGVLINYPEKIALKKIFNEIK